MVVFPQFGVADKNPVRRKKRRHQARDPVPPFPVPQIRARKGEEGGKAEPPETGSFPLRRQGCGVARRGGVELLEPLPEGWLMGSAECMASGRARPKRSAECRHYCCECNLVPAVRASNWSTPTNTSFTVIKRMQSSVPRGQERPPCGLHGRQNSSFFSTITARSL